MSPGEQRAHKHMFMHDLNRIKASLPDYIHAIGVDDPFVTPYNSFQCLCPIHADTIPSFSANLKDNGWVWYCHACGLGGDIIKLHALLNELHRHIDFQRILREIEEALETKQSYSYAKSALRTVSVEIAQGFREPMQLPPFHTGTSEEIATVARSRNLCSEAVTLAQDLSTLVFADVCGLPCWLLTDDSLKSAEARRMHGELFPTTPNLAARKAHTLRGSSKSWPVGVEVLRRKEKYAAIMLVEGGPDYLAGLHFACTAGRSDLLPVAMLGRGAGKMIDPEAMELLRGRRVRIYPHNDADGGGMVHAKKWAAQLYANDCQVDIYPFDGLIKDDGLPVKDLNDAAMIAATQKNKITKLVP